jgi:pimeloyl-ACP methyl ester carboxylesterase
MKCVLVTIALSLCSQLACAAPLPSAEDFFKTADMRGAAISPQAQHVAILLTVNDSGKHALAVLDTADLKHYVIVAASTEEAPIIGFRWINENRLSYSINNLRPLDRGSIDEFVVNRDGSAKRHLIFGDINSWGNDPAFADGLSTKPRQLPMDYRLFDVPHDGSDDIIVKKDLWGAYDPAPDHSRLFRVNTFTAHRTDLMPPGQPDHAMQWVTDAGGNPRAVTTRERNNCSTWYRQPGARKWTSIHTEECIYRQDFMPRFFDGKGQLYVSADYQGSSALFRFDASSMQLEAKPLLSTPGFDYDGEPVFDYPGQTLLGIHIESDAPTTVWFDDAMKTLQRQVDAALPQTVNRIACPNDCRRAPALLITAGSDRQPDQYYLYSPTTRTLIRLGETHPGIQAAQMGWRDFYHYRARDGRDIPVYVTLPPGKHEGPLPTVVLVHGGPFLRGVHWKWNAGAQYLAVQGYAVIEPEFRGSKGYGTELHRAGLRQWGLSMEDDLADAAQWAAQQGWADPRRTAIMGASYGGYATMMGLIRFPELFRCGVEMAGPSDIKLLYRYGLMSQVKQEAMFYAAIGEPDTDGAQFDATSPLKQAARLKQPLLIVQGLDDPVVPQAHAFAMLSALRKTNDKVEWLPYPGEIHGFKYQADQIDFWKRVNAFLAKNL